ncbi:MAG: polyprenyl synthetase family protein [bacterium]|nr:polyprenyl synthetase family protein [bacterium]
MNSRGEPDLKQLLARSALFFNDFLSRRIVPDLHRRVVLPLAEPMIYSLDAPGKRLRPVLCLWAAGIQPGESGRAFSEDAPASETPTKRELAACYAAAAVEAIHTYSLIHDDLPAMDDDDLRRGRPACHRKFSEWAAILAGDALNTYAFELVGMAARSMERTDLLPDLLTALAEGAGRMVCGQALDLDTEELAAEQRDIPNPRERLNEIHTKKTAALIRASLELGAILGGVEQPSERAKFREFGEGLGLLFQIADDLLDVRGDSAALGKTAGKDAASGKLTYPAQYGVDESERQARELRSKLETLAERLSLPAPELNLAFQGLPAYVAERKS